uniref:ENT domain-containing protein n=1 Tax=Panagrellus redivivus TaxID=6233 RepID=A0A7E4ZYC4_PANRE
MDDSEPSSSTAPQVPLRSRICSEGNGDDELAAIANRVRHSLNIEDSVYLLQKFEKNAFRAVVAAFRAQGPLTPYKELILEHLKFALFIKDHDYVTNIQEAADDPVIKNLCKTMNASYSSSDEWRKLAFTAHSRKGTIIRDALTSKNPSRPPDRTKLIAKIGSHNVSVCELDLATAKLCNLRKERWVPQVLRRELYNTEAANGRIDIDPIDVSETEFEHEMDVYEERRDRLENERFAADYSRRRKHVKGRKLTAAEKRKRREKAPLPPFYDETLRAQARAAAIREERIANNDDIPLGALSDGLTEEVQQRAEMNMMKYISDSLRATSVSPVRQIVPPTPPTAATTSRSAPNVISAPIPAVVPTPPTPIVAATLSLPASVSLPLPQPTVAVPQPLPVPEAVAAIPVSHASTIVNLRQQFLSAVAEVKDAVNPSPKKRGKKKDANGTSSQKGSSSRRGQAISDNQRDLDEALVLEKTAQAMIEDLENAASTSTCVPMDVDPVVPAALLSTPSTSTARLVTPEKSPIIHVVSPVKPVVSRPPENGVSNVKRPAAVTPVRVPPQRPLPKITPCEAPTAPAKRRGRRPADPRANLCARVLPFVFDEVRPDGSKPPRGNPDKRFCSALKRINTFGQPPVHPKAMIAKPATNGVPSAAPVAPVQSDASPSRANLPKSAIVPTSAIVIRPRANSISSSSPGNPQSTPPQVPVIEASPAKRMRYVSETNSNAAAGAVNSSPSTSTAGPSGSGTSISGQSTPVASTSAGIPIVRHTTGRPTLFRPPNVVFPRASNALNNGNPRYVVPYNPQTGGSPSRPYYPNTTFTPRGRTSDRPVLLSLTRNPSPQTTVRFVSPTLNDSNKPMASASNPELSSNGPLRTTVRLPNGGPLQSRSIIAPFSKLGSTGQGDGSAPPRQSITIIRPELRQRVPVPVTASTSAPTVATTSASAQSVTSTESATSTSTYMSSIDAVVTSIANVTPVRPVDPTVVAPRVASVPIPVSPPVSTPRPAMVPIPVSSPTPSRHVSIPTPVSPAVAPRTDAVPIPTPVSPALAPRTDAVPIPVSPPTSSRPVTVPTPVSPTPIGSQSVPIPVPARAQQSVAISVSPPEQDVETARRRTSDT